MILHTQLITYCILLLIVVGLNDFRVVCMDVLENLYLCNFVLPTNLQKFHNPGHPFQKRIKFYWEAREGIIETPVGP